MSRASHGLTCSALRVELERLRSLPDGTVTGIVHPDVSDCDALVVVAHYREDLTWLRKAKRPIAVVSKHNANKSIPNVGGDVSSYLWFLSRVSHDALPSWLLMIHAHERHWHHPTSQLHSIGIALSQATLGFLNINHDRSLSMLRYYERCVT